MGIREYVETIAPVTHPPLIVSSWNVAAFNVSQPLHSRVDRSTETAALRTSFGSLLLRSEQCDTVQCERRSRWAVTKRRLMPRGRRGWRPWHGRRGLRRGAAHHHRGMEEGCWRLRLTTERSRTHKQRRSIFLVQKPLAAPALSPLCGAVCVWQLWLRLLCLNQESRQRVSFFSVSHKQCQSVSGWFLTVFPDDDRAKRLDSHPRASIATTPPIQRLPSSRATSPLGAFCAAACRVILPACRHSFAVCPLDFNWHSLPSSTPILLRSKTHAHGLGSSAR